MGSVVTWCGSSSRRCRFRIDGLIAPCSLLALHPIMGCGLCIPAVPARTRTHMHTNRVPTLMHANLAPSHVSTTRTVRHAHRHTHTPKLLQVGCQLSADHISIGRFKPGSTNVKPHSGTAAMPHNRVSMPHILLLGWQHPIWQFGKTPNTIGWRCPVYTVAHQIQVQWYDQARGQHQRRNVR